MKRIAIVVVSTILLAAGCQKTEIVNPVGEPAMTFTTGLSKLTKASDANADGHVNLAEQDFRLWAYTAYVDPLNNVKIGDDYDNMVALPIQYSYTQGTEGSNGTGACTTDKDYYWPGTNKKLDFFAVSTGKTWASESTEGTEGTNGLSITVNNLVPEGEGAAAIETNLPAVIDRTITLSNYTVDASNPNDDLMVADFVRQDQSQNGKNVPLNFRHTLSKIQFLFKTNMKMGTNDEGQTVELTMSEQDTVLVQSIAVTDVKNSGTLTVTATAPESETDVISYPVTSTWTEQTGAVEFNDDYKYEFTAWAGKEKHKVEVIKENGGNEKVLASNLDDKSMLLLNGTATEFATWLVIPQTIKDEETTALTVKVTYIINSRQFEAVFPLYTDALTKWDVNQYVKYTVTLTPNKIGFNASVENWAQYDADSTEDGNQDIEMNN